MVLDSLTKLLGIEQDKVFSNLREIGNTVSSSIPIALQEAIATGQVTRGDLLILSGFGVGLSWGTAILQL